MTETDLTSVESHFAFGKNWANFAQGIDQKTISEADAGLLNLIGAELIKGASFLDIGCGSGCMRSPQRGFWQPEWLLSTSIRTRWQRRQPYSAAMRKVNPGTYANRAFSKPNLSLDNSTSYIPGASCITRATSAKPCARLLDTWRRTASLFLPSTAALVSIHSGSPRSAGIPLPLRPRSPVLARSIAAFCASGYWQRGATIEPPRNLSEPAWHEHRSRHS